MEENVDRGTNQRSALREPQHLLTISDVRRAVRRAKTWIMDAVRSGSFPRPTKISGRLYWSNQEVDDWIRDRLADRDEPTRPQVGESGSARAAEE